MEGSPGPTTAYQIAVAFLVVLLLTAIALVVSMAVRPGQSAAIAEVSTDGRASRCQPTAPGSVCFDNQIRNAGASAANFLCNVSSTEVGLASFTPGTSSSTMVYLQPGNEVTVQSLVEPTGGARGIGPPSVTCEDISS
jgi:hypothetical protein